MDTRYQKILIWLLSLIAFFLPLEYIGSFEIKGMNIRISQILALILMIAWFWGLARRKVVYRKNFLTWPLVIFLAVNLISIIKAQDLGRSIEVFIFLAFTIFFGWLIAQIVRSKEDLLKIIYALALSLVIVSLFGLWQFFGDAFGLPQSLTGLRDNYVKGVIGFTRIHATFREPLYYANYLFIPLFLLLAFWIKGAGTITPPNLPLVRGGTLKPSPLKRGSQRGWTGILIFLAFSNLVLTVARGAYLAFAPGLAILLFILRKELKNYKKVFYFSLPLLLALAFSFSAIKIFDGSREALRQANYEEHVANIFTGSSFTERQETMSLAWRAWEENPLLGLGVGGFGPYAKDLLPWWQRNEMKIVNNEYLEILAETGLLGFGSFIFLLYVIIRQAIKAIREAKDDYWLAVLAGLFSAFIAILLQYFTFSTLYIMYVWFLVGLLAAVVQICTQINTNSANKCE